MKKGKVWSRGESGTWHMYSRVLPAFEKGDCGSCAKDPNGDNPPKAFSEIPTGGKICKRCLLIYRENNPEKDLIFEALKRVFIRRLANYFDDHKTLDVSIEKLAEMDCGATDTEFNAFDFCKAVGYVGYPLDLLKEYEGALNKEKDEIQERVGESIWSAVE